MRKILYAFGLLALTASQAAAQSMSFPAAQQEAARKAFCGELAASLNVMTVSDDQVGQANEMLNKLQTEDRWGLAHRFDLTYDAASALMEDARVQVMGKHTEHCTDAELHPHP